MTLNLTQLFARLTSVKPNFINADTRAIAAAVFAGSGLNDCTKGGTYTATVDHTYVFKITANGTPDTFQISVDGGAFGTPTTITGSAQSIANGLSITFGATTGHYIGDTWTVVCTAGVLITANNLMNLAQIAAGTATTLYLYDGTGTGGTLVYQSATANWAAGRNDQLGYKLTSGSLYAVLAVTTTAANLIIGTS